MNSALRHRHDRCPGALRPWPAADGLLVRLRVPGGRIARDRLAALLEVAEAFGDGRVHATSRANLQLRGLPDMSTTADSAADDAAGWQARLPETVLTAIGATGLLPSRSHELIRNIMASPLTGLDGGRADLSGLVTELDQRLCAEPELAALSGRILFVLDDGRGDLVARTCDLGVVALSGTEAQLRIGEGFGAVVPLERAPALLVELALAFQRQRGTGAEAPWHVRELPGFEHPLATLEDPAPGTPREAAPLAFGPTPVGPHLALPRPGIARAWFDDQVPADAPDLVITPVGGLLVPRPSAGHDRAADTAAAETQPAKTHPAETHAAAKENR